MRHRHQAAPTRSLNQLMIPSYDTTNTSSKMGTLPFWCVSLSHDNGVHSEVIGQIVYRLTEHSTVSIDISSLGTQGTSPPDLTSSAFVTTKLSLSPYH